MADLPDITTTNVSFVAFWNAIDDGGLSTIEASDVLSYGNIDKYTLYDNGVDGELDVTRRQPIRFRVKNDGWFVAWLDRDEVNNQYPTHINDKLDPQDGCYGPFDIAKGWSGTGAASLEQNTLEREIRNLAIELENWGDAAYSSADVGLYNYEHTTADSTTLLSEYVSGSSLTRGFLYTSGTTIDAIWVMGSGYVPGHADNGPNDARVTFEGTTIAANPTDGERGIGSRESSDLVPDADTEYQMQLEDAAGFYDPNMTGTVVVIWE